MQAGAKEWQELLRGNIKMEEQDIQKKIDPLVKGLKRPIPEDPKLIKNRYLWLTFACASGCNSTLKPFQKQLKTCSSVTLNSKEKVDLLFEMHILALTRGLMVVKDILYKHLSAKKEEELDDIISDCEVDCFIIMEWLYHDIKKSREDIFKTYEEYSWLCKPDIIKGHNKSEFIEKLYREIREFSRIDDDTGSQEEHFAIRVKNTTDRIDKTILIYFAKQVIFQGLLLAMDAFAAVEQDKIDNGLQKYFEVFKEAFKDA